MRKLLLLMPLLLLLASACELVRSSDASDPLADPSNPTGEVVQDWWDNANDTTHDWFCEIAGIYSQDWVAVVGLLREPDGSIKLLGKDRRPVAIFEGPEGFELAKELIPAAVAPDCVFTPIEPLP